MRWCEGLRTLSKAYLSGERTSALYLFAGSCKTVYRAGKAMAVDSIWCAEQRTIEREGHGKPKKKGRIVAVVE